VNGGSRKGCLWGLNPAKADKMDEEITKWIKRASKSNGAVNGSKAVLSLFYICLLPLIIDSRFYRSCRFYFKTYLDRIFNCW